MPEDADFAYRYIPETGDWKPKRPARADGGKTDDPIDE